MHIMYHVTCRLFLHRRKSSIRIPSGNELGAWPEYWEPGGYTSGGVKEAVVNPAAEGTYTYEHLFE